MMTAHREDAVLTEDGTLVLKNLPFHAGESVEVIVLPLPKPNKRVNLFPLRGTVLRFDNPQAPATDVSDWVANE